MKTLASARMSALNFLFIHKSAFAIQVHQTWALKQFLRDGAALMHRQASKIATKLTSFVQKYRMNLILPPRASCALLPAHSLRLPWLVSAMLTMLHFDENHSQRKWLQARCLEVFVCYAIKKWKYLVVARVAWWVARVSRISCWVSHSLSSREENRRRVIRACLNSFHNKKRSG